MGALQISMDSAVPAVLKETDCIFIMKGEQQH